MSEWRNVRVEAVDPAFQPRHTLVGDHGLLDPLGDLVCRVGEAGANATDIQPTADPLLIINMSVWADAESLFAYVYRSAHTPVMARRRDWFDRFEGAYMALWWIPAVTIPTINDGLSRLWHLDRFGPTPYAFTFKLRFPAPGVGAPPVDMQPDPWCVGNA